MFPQRMSPTLERPGPAKRVVETAAENWSFGNGEAQFHRPA